MTRVLFCWRQRLHRTALGIGAGCAGSTGARVLDLHRPTRALPDVVYVEGSVLDPGLVDEALSGVDEVYYLAGLRGMWIPHKNKPHDVNCRGTEVVMERGQVGHRYILGSESIPLKKLLGLVPAISGRRNLLIPVPGRIAETATAMLELIADHVTRRPPSGTAEGVRIALRAMAPSIEKAQHALGYAPRPVEPALRETIAYLLGAR